MKVQNEPSNTISKKYLLNKLLEDIRDNTYSYRSKMVDNECKEAISIVNALFGRLDYCSLVIEWGKVMDMNVDTNNALLKEVSLEIQTKQIEQIMKDIPLNVSHGEFYPAIQVNVNKQLRANLLIELANSNVQTFEYLFENFINEYSRKLENFETINFTPGIEQLNKQFDGQIELIINELKNIDINRLASAIKSDLHKVANTNLKELNDRKVNLYFKEHYPNINLEKQDELFELNATLKDNILNDDTLSFGNKQLLNIANGETVKNINLELYSNKEQSFLKKSMSSKKNEMEM